MRKHFVKWLERAGRYFPVMRPILEEEGMPAEIIYLTMIESGVNPTARSWAACVGLWQFLKSTGEMYGLRGDWHTDDRCDPEKATRAAARHLRDLYNRFDDWHLALAAYNAGAGRISRAIKKSRKEKPTFWDIVPYLPRETQNYVPRFIATAIVALDPMEYDLADVVPQKPLEYDVVTTDRPYNIKDLAQAVESTQEELETLNPTLLQPQTPPRAFQLRIPKGRQKTFAANIGNIEVRSTIETVVVEHKVKRGDNLYKLAKRHNVTVGQIVKANELSSARHLRVGEILRIPKREVVTTTSYKVAMDNVVNPDTENDPTRRTEGREKLVVTVEPGMTLGGIARNFGVTVADLMTWNGMKSSDRLAAGRSIDVWVKPGEPLPGEVTAQDGTPLLAELHAPEAGAATMAAGRSVSGPRGVEASASATPEEYTVQRGETLASIADAFNLTIQNLIDWNKLEGTAIRSGSTLKLKPEPAHDTAVQDKPAVREKTSVKDAKKIKGSWQDELKRREGTRAQSSSVPGGDSVYVVRKGETMYRIATEHGVTVEQLMEWNGLTDHSLRVGQKLVVRRGDGKASTTAAPSAAPKTATQTQSAVPVKAEAPAKTDTPAKAAPVVKSGAPAETAAPAKAAPAVKSGAPAETAAPAKAVKSGAPANAAAAEKHAPPAKAVDVEAASEAAGDDAEAAAGEAADARDIALKTVNGRYTVQPGDNLFRIARASGLSVEELQELNGLTSNNLRAGQELIVVRPSGAGVPAAADSVKSVKEKEHGVPSSVTPQAPASGTLRQDAAGRVQSRTSGSAEGVRHEHVVQKGETLHSISRTLGIPVERLKKWNHLGRYLQIGQKIVYYTNE